MAGLTPTMVDLTPFAVLRALASVDQLGVGGEAEAIVDIGASVTNIIVHQGGVPRFVRILLMGGGDVTEAVAERMGVPIEHAESVKQSMGLVAHAADGHPAGRVIETTASTFVDEVRGSLDYYMAQAGAARLRRLLITGGGSQLEGLAARLSSATRLPVEFGSPMSTLHIGKTGLSSEQLDLRRAARRRPGGTRHGGGLVTTQTTRRRYADAAPRQPAAAGDRRGPHPAAVPSGLPVARSSLAVRRRRRPVHARAQRRGRRTVRARRRDRQDRAAAPPSSATCQKQTVDQGHGGLGPGDARHRTGPADPLVALPAGHVRRPGRQLLVHHARLELGQRRSTGCRHAASPVGRPGADRQHHRRRARPSRTATSPTCCASLAKERGLSHPLFTSSAEDASPGGRHHDPAGHVLGPGLGGLHAEAAGERTGDHRRSRAHRCHAGSRSTPTSTTPAGH